MNHAPDNSARHPEGRVRDAVDRSWVDHRAPPGWRPYLRLARADRPIGTWLLLIPSWWGITLGVISDGWKWIDLWLFPAMAIGAFVMRGAGCTWNDIADRDIDAQVGANPENLEAVQALGIDPLGIGVAGEDRQQAAATEFGGLLGDEVGTGLLDRCEGEPEVGGKALDANARAAGEGAAALACLGDLGQPFAVAAVEHQDRATLGQAHHPEQVMGLVAGQVHEAVRPKGGGDEEPDFRADIPAALCHNCPHGSASR